MRLILFFDLPTLTAEDRREYRYFRKNLIKNGFFMMQESVYTRMVLNASVENSVKEKIMKIKPKKGLVQMITITEKQFSKMLFIVGENNTNVINSVERIVFL